MFLPVFCSVDCDYLASETVPSEETSRCAVDRLPSADVEFEEVHMHCTTMCSHVLL